MPGWGAMLQTAGARELNETLCFLRLHGSFFPSLCQRLSNTTRAVRARVSCVELPSALTRCVTSPAEAGGVLVAGRDRPGVGAAEQCQLLRPWSPASEPCAPVDGDKGSRGGGKRTDSAVMRSRDTEKTSGWLSSWRPADRKRRLCIPRGRADLSLGCWPGAGFKRCRKL